MPERPFRLLALDLDGTLLDGRGELPALTEDFLTRLRRRGMAVVVATGRMSPSARPYLDRLGGEGGYAITYNGGQVITAGRALLHRPLDLSAARRALVWARESGIYIQAYCNDRLLVERLEEKALDYARAYGVEAHPVGNLLAALEVAPTKLLAIGRPEEVEKWRNDLPVILGGQVEVFRSAPPYLDVMAAGVSKGDALRRLASSLGIRREEVLAFGDGENDREMLAWAGLGVAMDHAPPTAREAADLVVSHDDGLGVARTLAELFEL